MSRYRKTRNRKQQRLDAMLQERQISLPFPEPQVDIISTEYDPSLCKIIIQHCKKGASIFEFAAELNVSTSILNQWAEENPEFAHAMDIANTMLKAYWLKLAEEECRSRFSINIWKHLMLHLFGPVNDAGSKDNPASENERCVVILPEIKHIDESSYTETGKNYLEAPAGSESGT